MKNKTARIVVDVILIVLGIVFLVFGIKDAVSYYNSSKIDDATKFKKEYSYVEKDNVYKYITIKEMEELLNKGSNVILVGDPEDVWTQILVNPLDEVIKEKDGVIYYLDASEISSASKYYEKVIDKLDIKEFTSPSLIFVKDGEIIEILTKEKIYDEAYDEAPIDYFTDERLSLFKTQIEELLEQLN